MMPFFLVTARKDLKRRMADPLGLLSSFGIPVIIGGLMSFVMGGEGGGIPRAKLLLVDQDDSFVSQGLAGLVSGAGADSMLELVSLEYEEARAQIDRGEGSALLVIPAGFGESVLQSEPTELRLVTNPSQVVLPRIIEEGLEMLVEATFYGQQLFGDELRLLSKGPAGGSNLFGRALIAGQAGALNDRMVSLENVVFPPLLELKVEVIEKERGQPKQSPMSLFFPGVLFMGMLFIAQSMSSDLWEEINSGALRRLRTTPRSLYSFLAGKVLASAALVGAVTGLGLLIGLLAFDFPSAGILPAWLWGTFSGAALVPLFLWAQSLGTNQQAGSLLTSMLLFPLMMLGGSLFPMESMPDWMVDVGRWTPNGMGLIEFKGLVQGDGSRAWFKGMVQGDGSAASLAVSFLCLMGASTLFFFLCARRTQRKVTG